jgi:hypothetical protein
MNHNVFDNGRDVETSNFKAMENNHYAVCLHDIILNIGVIFTMIVV